VQRCRQSLEHVEVLPDEAEQPDASRRVVVAAQALDGEVAAVLRNPGRCPALSGTASYVAAICSAAVASSVATSAGSCSSLRAVPAVASWSGGLSPHVYRTDLRI
jgi:hypothetical protein